MVYAMKMMKKKEILNLKQLDHIYSEYCLLSEINHKFIVYFPFNISFLNR